MTNPWPARIRTFLAAAAGIAAAAAVALRIDALVAGVVAGAVAGFVLGAVIIGALAFQLGRTHARASRQDSAAAMSQPWMAGLPTWSMAPLAPPAPAPLAEAQPLVPATRQFVIGDDGQTVDWEPGK